ncbi:hypothetical protein P7K49_034038, partial [Saguinus oedipus]
WEWSQMPSHSARCSVPGCRPSGYTQSASPWLEWEFHQDEAEVRCEEALCAAWNHGWILQGKAEMRRGNPGGIKPGLYLAVSQDHKPVANAESEGNFSVHAEEFPFSALIASQPTLTLMEPWAPSSSTSVSPDGSGGFPALTLPSTPFDCSQVYSSYGGKTLRVSWPL